MEYTQLPRKRLTTVRTSGLEDYEPLVLILSWVIQTYVVHNYSLCSIIL